jgi:hypothetical protein
VSLFRRLFNAFALRHNTKSITTNSYSISKHDKAPLQAMRKNSEIYLESLERYMPRSKALTPWSDPIGKLGRTTFAVLLPRVAMEGANPTIRQLQTKL